MKIDEFFTAPKIINALEEDKLIIFVGAGLSQSVGNPNWEGLVKKIVEHVSKQTGKKSITSYIDFLEEKEMSVFRVLEQLEEKYRKEVIDGLVSNIINNVISNNHKKIFEVSKKVITTNYDNLLEFNNNSITPFTYQNHFHVGDIHNKEEFILKLHGDIYSPNECVLFESQYESIYNQKTGIIFQMGNLIQHNTFLFIGFSFNDPYVKELFEGIDRMLSKFTNRHYLISTEISEELAKKSYLEVVKINNWNELNPILDNLTTVREGFKKKSKVQFEKDIDVEDEFIDENEFKDFIIDFHQKSTIMKKQNIISTEKDDKKFKELQKKFDDMRCTMTMEKSFEKRYSVRFPIINEILSTEAFIETDKKEVLTEIIVSEYEKMDLSQYEDGGKVFQALVDRVVDLYNKGIKIDKGQLRYYLTIFVAWVINECDIFNEKIPVKN